MNAIPPDGVRFYKKDQMEVAGHFIFELFKIAILASLYATVLLILAKIIEAFSKHRGGDFQTGSAWSFWIKSGAGISLVLFCWMFTYWGDHGLGDSARIPIGHGKAVREINANNTYIEVSGEQYGIGEFTYDDDFLCAEYSDGPVSAPADFVVWNLTTNTIQPMQKSVYLKGVEKLSFPATSTFQDFAVHYEVHWNGLRFWLLP